VAEGRSMTAIIIIEAISALIVLALAWTAPEGWQDEDGFHVGRED